MKDFINRPFYSKYAWAYDQIITRDYKADCDFIEKIINKRISKEHISILDVGCGTGNYSIELAQRGYKVTGIDLSKEQIAVANSKLFQKRSELTFLQADMFNLKFEQTFDVILCRGVLNDIIDCKLRKKIFHIFKSLLNTDGLLIFDVRDWDNSYKYKKISPITEKSINLKNGTLLFKSETKFNVESKQLLIKETHVLKSNNTNERDEFNFIMRCWTIDEIKSSLSEAHFENFDFYGDYKSDVKFGETEKIIVVAS